MAVGRKIAATGRRGNGPGSSQSSSLQSRAFGKGCLVVEIDRERLALRIAEARTGVVWLDWGVVPEIFREQCRASVNAILAEITAQGFVIAPREPGEEIIIAGWRGRKGSFNDMADAYRAMIHAIEASR